MNDDHSNPAVPTSIGALLAEEVTMDPYSTLPSFLEMMMIEEASSSARKTMASLLQSMVTSLSSMVTPEPSSRFQEWKSRLSLLGKRIGEKFGPEILFLVTFLVERQFLASSSALVAESLYGGRRVKLGRKRELQPLRDLDKDRVALLLPLFTLLKERAEGLFVSLRDKGQLRRLGKLQRLFLAVYPYLHMTHEGTILAYQLLYLMGKSTFFSPSSHLLGMVVRRVTAADSQTPRSSVSSKHVDQATKGIQKLALWGGSSVILLGWFLRWRQHTQQLRNDNRTGANRLPPFPQAPKLSLDPSQRIKLQSDPRCCPLCQQPRIHPSATPSGFVFCNRCLTLYVRQHGTCPLTGKPCPEDKIIRLYEAHDH